MGPIMQKERSTELKGPPVDITTCQNLSRPFTSVRYRQVDGEQGLVADGTGKGITVGEVASG